jgi:hypothetical protein
LSLATGNWQLFTVLLGSEQLATLHSDAPNAMARLRHEETSVRLTNCFDGLPARIYAGKIFARFWM